MSPQEHFTSIQRQYCQLDGVTEGNMMRSEALKYNDKVLAFFNDKTQEMGFRLGPDFDPTSMGIDHIQPLSPFKSKPPLKGWYMVAEAGRPSWDEPTEKALTFTKTLK